VDLDSSESLVAAYLAKALGKSVDRTGFEQLQ